MWKNNMNKEDDSINVKKDVKSHTDYLKEGVRRYMAENDLTT